MLSLSGLDRAGKSWHVDLFKLYGCSDGAHVYEGDVDRDGVVDAVLLMATCANGLAPTNVLTVVTFDSEGRPVPFDAGGYFQEQPKGIDSLVDLNGDGRADLVYMNFDDGYWITNIYSVDKAQWRRVNGPFAGRRFPLYTRFTNRPNKVAVTPPSSRHPFAEDLSTNAFKESGTLTEWRWDGDIKRNNLAELRVTLATGARNDLLCWADYVRLVINNRDGRRVVQLSSENSTFAETTLRGLLKDFRLRLFGQRFPDGCSPELIWADAIP